MSSLYHFAARAIHSRWLKRWPRGRSSGGHTKASQYTPSSTLPRAESRAGASREKQPGSMAAGGGSGVVKHIVLARFKEEVTPERLDQLIQGYAALVDAVPSMKSFHWGTNVSIENTHEGFTHVFESTFESTEGIKEYVKHPAHVEYANEFLSVSEKILIIDYKPTSVN
ncbi:hypothetical protein SEVIR_5G182800v4 [Setaria viridis]|nr:stress-response A/B barrel domain-containing protein HS1-like [Setaria viridis]